MVTESENIGVTVPRGCAPAIASELCVVGALDESNVGLRREDCEDDCQITMMKPCMHLSSIIANGAVAVRGCQGYNRTRWGMGTCTVVDGGDIAGATHVIKSGRGC